MTDKCSKALFGDTVAAMVIWPYHVLKIALIRLSGAASDKEIIKSDMDNPK